MEDRMMGFVPDSVKLKSTTKNEDAENIDKELKALKLVYHKNCCRTGTTEVKSKWEAFTADDLVHDLVLLIPFIEDDSNIFFPNIGTDTGDGMMFRIADGQLFVAEVVFQEALAVL